MKINVDPQGTLVKTADYWRAASNWQDVSWDEQQFAAFVGKHPNQASGHVGYYLELPKDKAHRVELLLGSYYKALIHMWFVQQGLNPPWK